MGTESHDVNEMLDDMRELCAPGVSLTAYGMRKLADTWSALDAHLSGGGIIPRDWRASGRAKITIRATDVHTMFTDEVEDEVRACEGKRDISDSCAVGIASWWTTDNGNPFNDLAIRGHACEYHALIMEIDAAYAADKSYRDRRALTALREWATAKAREATRHHDGVKEQALAVFDRRVRTEIARQSAEGQGVRIAE